MCEKDYGSLMDGKSMKRLSMNKAVWTDGNVMLVADQKRLLELAFECIAEWCPRGVIGTFRLVLDYLAEYLSGWHMPFTVVYEAAKEYCGIHFESVLSKKG